MGIETLTATIMTLTTESLARTLNDIRKAGGVPNSAFYRAKRALAQLERITDRLPPPEGTDYDVTLANGRTVTVSIPKGADIWTEFKARGLEVQSFSKR